MLLPSSRQFQSSIQTICIGVWCKSAPQYICTKQRAKISCMFKPMFPLSTLPPPGFPTFCAVFSPRPSIPSSVSLSSEFSSPGKGSRLALHRRGRAQTHSSKGPPGVSSKQGKLPSFTLGICATCLKWINSLKVCPQHNSIQYAHQFALLSSLCLNIHKAYSPSIQFETFKYSLLSQLSGFGKSDNI